ncbi:MAG: PIG-L family deacetylase [Saprospiraceae bacterium]|nr:PIG-L family deacetylase [Lewinella sp.]
MLESFRNKRVLVVVAHPDDEVLGVGASMHRLIVEYNCQARAIILGEGITSRSNQRDTEKWKNELADHRKNIEDARRQIGYESVGIYQFPDNRFDGVDLLDIIKVIEKEKEEFLPNIILTHHGGDLNIDHRRTFEAVITACRPMEKEPVNTIVTFETMSGTEWRASSDPKQFIPNFFIQISMQDLEAKIKAMEAYEYERREYPHPRSPRSLEIRARMWGIANGVELAEAFQIIRIVEKYEDR